MSSILQTIVAMKSPLTSKIILWAFFLAITPLSLFAQDRFNGHLLDGISKDPIGSAVVITATDTTISDENGYFSIEIESIPGALQVQHVGYENRALIVSTDKLTITLTPSTLALNEVTISAGLRSDKIKNIAGSVNVIDKEMMRRDAPFSITNSLNRVPGVYMHSGTLSTSRITIRGIGSRSLYGTTKIKAYYDQVPLTDGSGNSTIEDIDQGLIQRVEVLKGPNSSTYGAGLAGVLKLYSPHPSEKGVSISSGLSMGSFNTIRWNNQVNISDERQETTVVYSKLHSDGFRANNQYDRDQAGLTTRWKLSERTNISLIATYTGLKAYIPSSINKTDFKENPEKAAFTWNAAKGFEEYDKWLAGLSFNHEFSGSWKLTSSIFSTFRDAYEPRPFDILAEKTTSLGTRNLISNTVGDWSLTGGFELFYDTYEWGTFVNDAPDSGSAKGARLSNNLENRTYVNVFAEVGYDLSQKMELIAGFNVNETTYDLEDRYDQDTIDQSGDYQFATVFSPRVGFIYHLTNRHHIFSNVSHGFSPPSLEETLTPEGQINPDIQPETGWNFEIGSRGNQNHFSYDLTAYYMQIENLLVAQRTAEDQYVGLNAGENSHFGVDLLLNYYVRVASGYTLNVFNSFSYMDYKFTDFINEGTDYDGNQLTGIPRFIASPGVEILSKSGFYGNINGQYVGEIPLNDANELYSDPYFILNSRIGYKQTLGSFQLDGYVGTNNLLDTNYASMLLINATGFGGASPRYYYPGNPRNYFGGLSIKYQL